MLNVYTFKRKLRISAANWNHEFDLMVALKNVESCNSHPEMSSPAITRRANVSFNHKAFEAQVVLAVLNTA